MNGKTELWHLGGRDFNIRAILCCPCIDLQVSWLSHGTLVGTYHTDLHYSYSSIYPFLLIYKLLSSKICVCALAPRAPCSYLLSEPMNGPWRCLSRGWMTTNEGCSPGNFCTEQEVGNISLSALLVLRSYQSTYMNLSLLCFSKYAGVRHKTETAEL